MEQAMAAYQASGNTAKVGDIATRLLQMQPDNLRTLNVIVFIARDCAARGAFVYAKDVGKGLLQLGQRGLDALPEWMEAWGAQPEAGKLHDQMAAIFAEAAGWGALENEYYSSARFYYEKAVALNPRNLLYLRQLAVADLNMSPIDLNGFWYCGKAIAIALQNKADAGSISFVCKLAFREHGGKLEEWDRIVSNTEKDSAPPPDFAKSLSLREPN
jgi:tetratricopeptide (TPR) repeat protein